MKNITGVSPANLDNYDPSHYDAKVQPDGTYTLVPVLWWDERSYADYQGDPEPWEPRDPAEDDATWVPEPSLPPIRLSPAFTDIPF